MKGILGTKVGMTQVFDENARVVPVTVIRVADCRVGQVKTQASDGYDAVQLCLGERRPNKVTKPRAGHARRWGDQAVPRHVVEIRTGEGESFVPGQAVTADVFEKGERADVVGVSKGKGTAGVMKRHNFAGLKASHGTHRVHRHGGAIGMCATPSRVLKGMRMPGHMGHARCTVQNLEIVEADPERALILVRGAVPGPRGGLVMVRAATKTPEKRGR